MYYIRRNTHTFLHIIWIKCMSIVKYYNKCSTLDILYIFTCYIQFVNSWNLKVGFLCNNNKSRWSPWILLQTNHRLHGTRCKRNHRNHLLLSLSRKNHPFKIPPKMHQYPRSNKYRLFLFRCKLSELDMHYNISITLIY